MEKGRMMLLHSAIIGILLYIIMIFILGQNENVAENRSILLAAVILIYMIVFGCICCCDDSSLSLLVFC
jgi:hypothetical protein